MMKHNISIIIPSLGNLVNLKRLLYSIQNQDFPNESYEVIIVLNGISISKIIEITEYLNSISANINLKVLNTVNKGVNSARNKGMESAIGEILLFLDDDCELSNYKFLTAHYLYHNKYTNLFAYGGGYSLPNGSNYFDCLYNKIQMKWLMVGLRKENETNHLLGGNFSIKSKIAKEFNIKFDENIVYGGSEYEFFKKAEKKCLFMVYNQLSVTHYTNENIYSLAKKVFKQGRGKSHIDKIYGVDENLFFRDEKLSFTDAFFKKLFNYIFWYGYYNNNSSGYKIIKHMFNDLINYINRIRFKLLNKMSEQIEFKKNNGDRF